MNIPFLRRRSRLFGFYLILAAIATVGAAAVAREVFRSGSGDRERSPQTFAVSALATVAGISLGRDDAPVVVVEFADYQCPACARFARSQGRRIKEQLVTNGLVRYVHLDFPLTHIHPHAVLAAQAARCANELDRFWDYHDQLFAAQAQWTREQDVAAVFSSYAGKIGMDEKAFSDCLYSGRFSEEVLSNRDFARSLAVPSTPAVFVNGKYVGIPSYEALEQAVREETRRKGLP